MATDPVALGTAINVAVNALPAGDPTLPIGDAGNLGTKLDPLAVWIAAATPIAAAIDAAVGAALIGSLTPSSKNAAFTAAVNFSYLCTGGSYAATLPAGAANAGKLLAITNVSATSVTVTPAGLDTISGQATWPLTGAYETVLLWAYANGWIVLGVW